MSWADHSRKYCDSFEAGLAIVSNPKLLSIFTSGAQAALDRATRSGLRSGPLRLAAVRIEETPGGCGPWAVYVRHEANEIEL